MAAKKSRYSAVERKGVNAVEAIVLNELGWIFREQRTTDMGIDGQIEQVDSAGFPTGRLIGVQIKSGASQVKRVAKKKTDKRLIYYGTLTHLSYWLSHTLPVVLVVHIPNEGTYWEVVNAETTVRTGKRFKLAIPIENVLRKETKDKLEKVFQGTPEQQRENRLAADEPLMRYIAGGGKVTVAMEDWVNKSLGRTPVNIYRVEDGEDVLERAYGLMYVGFTIKQVAQRLFPWARILIDEDFYDDNAPEESEDDAFSRAMDADNGIYHRRPTADDIRPYDEAGGEVEYYRLQLQMNEVGKAYLILADYKKIADDVWAKRNDIAANENVDDLSGHDDIDDE